MEEIYIVTSSNFADTLYFESVEGALDFIKDQTEDGYTSTIHSKLVASDEFERLMATMDEEDSSVAHLAKE